MLLDGVQPAAAKVLRLGSEPEEAERFVREAALLKQLRHRNIVGEPSGAGQGWGRWGMQERSAW